jgi:hypothetical protein
VRTRSIVIVIILCVLFIGCAKKADVASVDNTATINRLEKLVGYDVIVTCYGQAFEQDGVVSGVLTSATVDRNGKVNCRIIDISGDSRYITTDIDSIKLAVINGT